MSDAQPPERRAGSEAIPGLPTERFKRRTLVILVCVALAIGLVVVFGIPEFRKRLKARQLGELVAEAEAQFTNGDNDLAARTLARAYALNPQNPRTLRLMAKSLEQMAGGTPAAAYFWRQLIETKGATTEDTAAYASLLLRAGFRDDAQKFLDSVPQDERDTRPVLELRAAFLTADGQSELAEKMLHAAYRGDRGNPESQRKLAVLELSSPFPEVQENAVGVLLQIARSGGPEALNAMRALASQARLSAPQAAALREIIEKTAGASDERRLEIVSGILRALPTEREKIIAAEAERQQGRPFEKITAFAKWLASNNEHARLLSVLPPEQAIRDGGLFLSYVAAMEHMGRWKALRELIRKNPSIPIPPAVTALILARCAHFLKEPSDLVRSHLQDGLQRAAVVKDRATMMTIGNTADEFGQPDIALEAFTLLASQPQLRLSMLERMIQIRQRQRDLPAMIDLIDLCLKEQPNNPGYVEAWCYLKLLEGSEMEKAADTINRLVEADPGRVPTAALVQAFAAYRIGDLESAGRDANSVVASKLPPGQRAVLAGILQACGRDAAALRIAEKVPDSIVLPEENRFLKTAL